MRFLAYTECATQCLLHGFGARHAAVAAGGLAACGQLGGDFNVAAVGGGVGAWGAVAVLDV